MSDYFGKLIGQRSPTTDLASAPAPKPEPTPQAKVKVKTGKRNDPAYVQRSFYIHKETAKTLKARLALEELELSALVEELLTEWLDKFE